MSANRPDPATSLLDVLEQSEPGVMVRRIETLLPQIQAAQAKGFSRAQITQALQTFGITISPKLLSKYLWQIKRRRAPLPVATPPSAAPRPSASTPTQAPVTLPLESEPGVRGSHDPRFLDDIINTSPNLDKLVRNGRKGDKP